MKICLRRWTGHWPVWMGWMKRGCHFHPTTSSLFQFSTLLFSNFTSTAATRPLYVVTNKRFCVQHESERRVSKKKKIIALKNIINYRVLAHKLKAKSICIIMQPAHTISQTKWGRKKKKTRYESARLCAKKNFAAAIQLENSHERRATYSHILTYRPKTHKSNNKMGRKYTRNCLIRNWPRMILSLWMKGKERGRVSNKRKPSNHTVGGWKRKLQSGDATSYSKLSFSKLVIESVCFN